MEIFYAGFLLRIPVIVVCPSDRPSPWLTRWATVVQTIEEAVHLIRQQAPRAPQKAHTVYLAGPINGCSDDECKDWRNYVKRELA